MTKSTTTKDLSSIIYRNCDTVIVGTGAAGFCCADRLYDLGYRNMILLTEGVNAGTSRNTGSDKQTYYKLTLSGDEGDSIAEMAQTLFDGQAVDGDLAQCEAAESVPSFLHLSSLGVPFPTNRYGEFIGYKTDHDPRRRATSAGPLTSKLMTEALERSVLAKGITIVDHCQMIRILTDEKANTPADGQVAKQADRQVAKQADRQEMNQQNTAKKETGDKKVFGILCLDTKSGDLICYRVCNLVLATGGPAALYADSVFPASQHGASGLAFEAGVGGKNLTEWQFGIASLSPRWNVSGSYMQVLPRVISTDEQGEDEREFLSGAFSSDEEMLSQLFLKGYQWPFDARKALEGSSRIDLLVYQERVLKGRRIFLDYRNNPLGRTIPWDAISAEARDYLTGIGALQDTPIERLAHMNQPAIDFYRSRGVDLYTQPLEISVCAQHSNGGLCIDTWWKTNIEGIFAIGEAAGSHGVYRPGGSALNAGQVGAYRVAKWIRAHAEENAEGNAEDNTENKAENKAENRFENGEPDTGLPSLPASVTNQIEAICSIVEAMKTRPDNTRELRNHFAGKMSAVGGAFRSVTGLTEAAREVDAALAAFSQTVGTGDTIRGLSQAFYLRDQLLTMSVYLSAMNDYASNVALSRGSALYTRKDGSLPKLPSAAEMFRFVPDDVLDSQTRKDQIQEVFRHGSDNQIRWRKVRPLPDCSHEIFENVWRSYRENGNIE